MINLSKYKPAITGVLIALIAYAANKSDLIVHDTSKAPMIVYIAAILFSIYTLLKERNRINALFTIFIVVFTGLLLFNVLQISLHYYILIIGLLALINLIIGYNKSHKEISD